MRVFRAFAVFVMAIFIAPRAEAQLEAIISIIGGGYLAGKSQRDTSRDRQSLQKQIDADRIEQEELLKADKAERDRQIEARTDSIISGKIEPATADDLEILYDVNDGWDIAARPLVKPDKELYVISGRILNQDSDTVLVCQTLAGRNQYVGNYFTVRLSKKTKKVPDILDRMRINGPIALVGKYTRNLKYQTVAAGIKVMPVFEAEHIIIPNYVDSGSQ